MQEVDKAVFIQQVGTDVLSPEQIWSSRDSMLTRLATAGRGFFRRPDVGTGE